jgi:hypothetical protein
MRKFYGGLFMKNRLLTILLLLFVLISNSFSASRFTPTGELKFGTIHDIYKNNDQVEISGSGFAPNDQVIAPLMIIQNDDNTIDLKILQNNDLFIDELGKLSGFVILEGIDKTDQWAQILVSTLNSNVIPTIKVRITGDLEDFSTKKVSRAGTFSFSEASGDGVAQLNERFDIVTPNSGWTPNVLACVRREFNASDALVTTVGLAIADLSINGDQLEGFANNGSTAYQASTDSIGLAVLDGTLLFGNSTNGYSTIDDVAPTLISADAFAADSIFLTFDEPVDTIGDAYTRFTINNSSATPSDLVAIDTPPTASWKLALSPGFADRGIPGVTIDYTGGDPTNLLADASNNELADISGLPVQDLIPPDTTTIRNSSDSPLTIGDFLGSSTYILRAHVGGGPDGSLAGVTFEGSDNGSSWTPIGTDGDASDADFQYDWTIGSTRYKMLRARAFDTNGNETFSSVVGSATEGFNNNFEDTYRAIITQVVPSSIGQSAGTFRARLTVKLQNNYGDVVNTTGQNLGFRFRESTTSTETWWDAATGGSSFSTQIDTTIVPSADSANVWYSNTDVGGPNTLVLTEPVGNIAAHNGVVSSNGQTVIVTASTLVNVSNPDPLTNSNIDTIPGYQAITLSVNMSGSEDPGVSDDFRFIWGFNSSDTPGSYGVTDTSVDLTVAGGVLDFDLKKPVFDNIGAQYSYLYWWVENLSPDPNATNLEGGPISSSPSRLIVNPHLMTEAGVSGGDVSGGSLAVGQSDQELVSIKFTSDPSLATILISGLVFAITQSSTVNNADISTFHLYRDSGTLGTLDGADVELDNVAFGGPAVNFNSLNPVLSVNGSSDYILVTVDVLPGANPLHAIGLVLTDENSLNIQDNVINGSADAIILDPFTNLGTSSDVPLPVELSAFTAKSGYGKIMLKWETASELNNEGFYLFRSVNPDRDFEQLNYEIIPGNGNSNTAHSYEYVDKNVKENTTYYYKLSSKDFNGQILADASIVSATALALPQTFNIDQNYPNPFNPTTHFRFSIAEASRASLAIYNVLGQKIRTIFDNRLFEPGVYEDFSWNATDDSGNPISNGIYYYEFKIPNQNIRQVKKMLYLK